jgi:anti-anti-sigma factor
MEISKQVRGGVVELKVEGRLDGYWADHLATAVDHEIRQGSHHIQLDLSKVLFLSSAGIGTLVRLYKDLKSIQGSFAVFNCSRTVLKVLQLSKLEEILVAKTPGPPSVTAETPSLGSVTKVERAGAAFELYPLAAESRFDCQMLGNPNPLERGGFTKENCRTEQLSDSAFAIGLGALGEDFDECSRRFGEFIAVAGAVAYLPTDGSNVPDFLLAGENMAPEVQVCYGITCRTADQKPFAALIRFETKSDTPITLTALVECCLELSGHEGLGIIAVAETSGLVGAALRRSPTATRSDVNAFEFPAIRDWLSFTAERAYTKNTVLLAGVAVRQKTGAIAPLIRPFPHARDPLFGHFHAAAFSYRPLRKGVVDFKTSIRSLFEEQSLEGILHLLTDDRTISGSGESEFARGACWIAPISTITQRTHA